MVNNIKNIKTYKKIEENIQDCLKLLLYNKPKDDIRGKGYYGDIAYNAHIFKRKFGRLLPLKLWKNF